jgi:rubrerythrin
MTVAKIKELLKKVEMLEAKASILQQEAGEIKVMLQDIVDPENKKAKQSFERARKKAEKEANRKALIEGFKAKLERDSQRKMARAMGNTYGK